VKGENEEKEYVGGNLEVEPTGKSEEIPASVTSSALVLNTFGVQDPLATEKGNFQIDPLVKQVP